MNAADWKEYQRFVLGGRGTLWSDIARARFLRRLIASTISQLDALRARPQRNAQRIQQEEVALTNASRELAVLEGKLLTA